jgi:hypothetical protein
MNMTFTRFALPLALVAFACVPASAQVRVGVDLGALSIRLAPDAPPRPRVEYRTVRPSRAHVWIAGYWDRDGDRWAWAPGRWEEPSMRGSVWVRPNYINEGGSYRYEPAHWSHQRLVEGEEAGRWHNEHGRGRGKWDRDRRDDRDRDRHDNRDHDRH